LDPFIPILPSKATDENAETDTEQNFFHPKSKIQNRELVLPSAIDVMTAQHFALSHFRLTLASILEKLAAVLVDQSGEGKSVERPKFNKFHFVKRSEISRLSRWAELFVGCVSTSVTHQIPVAWCVTASPNSTLRHRLLMYTCLIKISNV